MLSSLFFIKFPSKCTPSMSAFLITVMKGQSSTQTCTILIETIKRPSVGQSCPYGQEIPNTTFGQSWLRLSSPLFATA